jgi:hypothetical protein
MRRLLVEAAERGARYLRDIANRRVAPLPADVAGLEALGGPLPQSPSDPAEVLALLDDIGSPATAASAGGRYFGFVTGGSLPAALVANWLVGAWDQNAAMQVMSPVAARLEEIVLEWMVDLLGLPSGSGAGFVTGTTMANFSALAAARTALLKRAGWDVEEDGMFGAPPLHVVVGDEVHVSVLKALSMLGLGRSRLTRVPADDQGRIRLDALPPLDDHTLVCVQAGNVNTGAFVLRLSLSRHDFFGSGQGFREQVFVKPRLVVAGHQMIKFREITHQSSVARYQVFQTAAFQMRPHRTTKQNVATEKYPVSPIQ